MKQHLEPEGIGRRIFLIRGHRVMIDRDLAALYQVPTKQLNRAVKRHELRFPLDFMFRMSRAEFEDWRCQIGTSNPSLKMGLRRCPYVFSEQGVSMLSSVLNSERAILVNIAIMRTFVELRETLGSSLTTRHSSRIFTATRSRSTKSRMSWLGQWRTERGAMGRVWRLAKRKPVGTCGSSTCLTPCPVPFS